MLNLIHLGKMGKRGNILDVLRHLLPVFIFAAAYYIIYRYDKDAFTNDENKELNALDFLYYSLVTQTTVGYGDITPRKVSAKVVTIIQLLTLYGVIMAAILHD